MLSVRFLCIFIFCEVYNFFIWFISGFYIMAAAEKLDFKLLATLDELRRIKETE